MAPERVNGGQRVRVLDLASGRDLLDVAADIDGYVSFIGDGSTIAISGERGVRMWDVDAARELLRIDTPGAVGLVAASPDGKRLAGVVNNQEIKVWAVADGHEMLSTQSERFIHDIDFSPDGRRLAAARSASGSTVVADVLLLNASTGLELLRQPQHYRYAADLARLQFQDDGRRLYLFNLEPETPSDAYQVWDATPTANEPRPRESGDKTAP